MSPRSKDRITISFSPATYERRRPDHGRERRAILARLNRPAGASASGHERCAPDPVVSCAWLAGGWRPRHSRHRRDLVPAANDRARCARAVRRAAFRARSSSTSTRIADTSSGLPHMLPPPEKFASRMRKRASAAVAVVAYDNHGLFSAARVVDVPGDGPRRRRARRRLPGMGTRRLRSRDRPAAARMERHFTPACATIWCAISPTCARVVEDGGATIRCPPRAFAATRLSRAQA